MQDLTPVEWAARPLKKFADFSGRASRAEYWWFYLATLIVQIPVSALDELLGGSDNFSSLYNLVILIPWLAVTVRRLHDTGRSWRWLLLPLFGLAMIFGALMIGPDFQEGESVPAFTIFAGLFAIGTFITIFVFMILPGTTEPNRYGPDPYGTNSLEEVFS